MNRKVGDLDENQLVTRIMQRLPAGKGVVVGPGDDCAALLGPPGRNTLILFKTDSILENVHFLADAPPRLIGRKSVARCVSDIAAMGGRPTQALVTLAVGAETPLRWVDSLYDGMQQLGEEIGFGICGGETIHSVNGCMISVSMLGLVGEHDVVLRSGGQPGDLLYVTGHLGGSLAGHHLKFLPRVEEGVWLAANAQPSAMIDLSDGLAEDLPRMASASGTGYQIDWDALPLNRGVTKKQAVSDGEDYELLFAIPESRVERLQAWTRFFPKTPLTHIGNLVESSEGMHFEEHGYDHFAKR